MVFAANVVRSTLSGGIDVAMITSGTLPVVRGGTGTTTSTGTGSVVLSNAPVFGGNVGIGTVVPTQTLDVVGNANVSGAFIAGSLCANSVTESTLPFAMATNAGQIMQKQMTLAAASTWYNIFPLTFAGGGGTVLVIGRIGLSDQTQGTFMCIVGSSTVDFINLIQGSASNVRVNAGYLQLLSASGVNYGRQIFLTILRIS